MEEVVKDLCDMDVEADVLGCTISPKSILNKYYENPDMETDTRNTMKKMFTVSKV